MKIGMLLDNEFVADPRVWNEASMLVQKGHEVHVICLNFGRQNKYELKSGIHINRIYIPRKIKNFLFIVQLIFPGYKIFWFYFSKKIIHKYNIKVIHAHDLYMALPAILLKQKYNIKIILDLHENFPAAVKAYTWAQKKPVKWIFKASKWERIENSLLQKSDIIIVLSDYFKKNLIERYNDLNAEKIFVYPNVPNLSEFQSYKINPSAYEFMKKGFWMVYFGVIAVRRGITYLLEAIERISNPEIKLLIVGPIDKHDKELFESKFRKFEKEGKLVYYPWKDISDLPSLLFYAKLGISPILRNQQHESGVANKIFQYMLLEKAILVSDCQPQVDIIKECQCGLYYQDRNIDDLVEKILWCYLNTDILAEMGRKGKLAILNKYNSDVQFQPVLEFYNNLESLG
jgi:glycosyltransferase involved in cell wall biosynthesis